MRHPYLFAALLICFSFNACTPNAEQENQTAKAKKPNIIFILTDDLGFGDIGVFFQNQRKSNNDRSEPWHFTPNLDQLAESGVQLVEHYCNAPVCAPSRASLLLGVHQGHANVRDNQFDKALEDNYTLGNVLQQLDYSTVAIGKWGLQGDNRWDVNGSEWPAFPLNRGFDDYFGYVRHVDGHEHYPKEGLYRDPKEVYKGRENIADQLDKCYTADLWTAFAKKWITDHQKGENKEKPFFMYLAYDTPHAVLELPTQGYPEGKGLSGGLQWTGEAGHMINTAAGEVDSWIHPDYANATYDDDKNSATPEVPWPDTYKRYATAVRRIDDCIGDMMQLLKDLEIDENTMIVFSSDNGPSQESYLPEEYVANEPTFFNSFGPFDGIKRDTWEGGVRMPVLVSWPARIPAKTIVETPAMLSDWMATFCQAAGSTAPARSDGVSLLPALTGKGEQATPLVYVEYFNNGETPNYEEFEPDHRSRKRNQMQLIRVDDYVGVRYDIKSANDDFEIYNVVEDPKEANNLAMSEDEKIAQLQEQMKAKVLQVRRPDTAATRPYDVDPVPAIVNQNVQPGIKWQAYTGTFPWVPQTNQLKATAKGEELQPSASLLKENDQVLLCEGYIEVPREGAYTFWLQAQGKAILRIHEATAIDADYGYTAGTERNASLNLEPGIHPFRIYFKRIEDSTPDFKISWQGPGISKQEIPKEAFFHD